VNGQDTVVASNDNWSDEANAADAATAIPGAFELETGSNDAVLLITLPAGLYTAVVRGVGETTGNAIIEVYDVP
jgi:hypothetical protein